ncbi:MAG: hypothetical protein M3R04_10365, partial [bacterium]|nr:hypothetical protein [bacterium]
EDAASVNADILTVAGAVRQDTISNLTSADGDYAPIKVDSVGRVYVNGSGVTQPVSGTVTVNAGTGFTADATHGSAALTTGPQVMGSGKNTTLPTAVTDGNAVRLLTDLYGRLQPKNVCENPDLISSVAIDTATAGNVQLVAISGSTVVTACGFSAVADGVVAVQFITGTGTACATGETDKTGPMAFVANGGINSGYGAPIFKGAAGEAACIELSAAIGVRGIFTYVQQ